MPTTMCMTIGLAMKFYLYSRLLLVWIWGIFVVLDAFESRDRTKIGSGLQFLSVSIYYASQCAKQVCKKTTDSPPENNQVFSPTSCVALGRISGMTFPTVHPARAIRKVVPKILPRATQDVGDKT